MSEITASSITKHYSVTEKTEKVNLRSIQSGLEVFSGDSSAGPLLKSFSSLCLITHNALQKWERERMAADDLP